MGLPVQKINIIYHLYKFKLNLHHVNSTCQKKILVYAAMSLLFACNSNSAQKKLKELSINHAATIKPAENFDLFFKKFNADSVFQKSRMMFPLKVAIAGGEEESDSIKYVSNTKRRSFKEWQSTITSSKR